MTSRAKASNTGWRRFLFFACVALVLLPLVNAAGAEEFTNAWRAYLQQRVDSDPQNFGMVAGLVDERGPAVVSYAKVENGSPSLTADTLFDISTVTKTFTALLLQDAVNHQQMALRDPISAHLPAALKIPPHQGREITLLDLATRVFGLPDAPGLSEFLAPAGMNGETKPKNLYGTAGMALLGQILARQAGTDYESLIVSRICRPLGMSSTCVALTSDLVSRSAIGHDDRGQPVPLGELSGLLGGAGLHSTANDLLKFLSAEINLTPAPLADAMKKTHSVYDRQGPFFDSALAWKITHELDGREIVWSANRGEGCSVFAGMDLARRRAVVVLSNSGQLYAVYLAGMLALQSEWRAENRPQTAKANPATLDPLPGQYALSPNLALGMFIVRQYLHHLPRALPFLAAALLLCALSIMFWLAPRRRRLAISGVAIALSAFIFLTLILLLAHLACSFFQPTLTIHREGVRLLAQYGVNPNRRASSLGSRIFPEFPAEFWPALPAEILPSSDTIFFDRLTGAPLTFSNHGSHKALLRDRLTFTKIN